MFYIDIALLYIYCMRQINFKIQLVGKTDRLNFENQLVGFPYQLKLKT